MHARTANDFASRIENIHFFKRVCRSCLYLSDKHSLVKVMKQLKHLTLFIVSALILIACSGGEVVPASECDKVVAHAKSILKENAPSQADTNPLN